MALYILACLAVLTVTYMVNATLISICYHRGLAHGAVTLSPWVRRFVAVFGIWLTGLDPKGWVCMHRRHHKHSDTKHDPHSPVTLGLFGVFFGQLRSYERTLIRLAAKDPRYTVFVKDIEFEVNALNRKRLWLLPYLLHLGISLAIAIPTGMWALGFCYYVGMMSHPIEGWIVNSFGHAMGSRNFDTPDNSRNNHPAAWLILGEGFQNNHHQYPKSAKFSYRPLELDPGYPLCWVMEKFGLLEIRRETLIPAFGHVAALPRRSSNRRTQSARLRRLSVPATKPANESSLS